MHKAYAIILLLSHLQIYMGSQKFWHLRNHNIKNREKRKRKRKRKSGREEGGERYVYRQGEEN